MLLRVPRALQPAVARVRSRYWRAFSGCLACGTVCSEALPLAGGLRHHLRKGMRLIEFFEAVDFVFRERNRKSSDRTVEMFHFCGTDNRCSDCGVAQHPGEGDL